MLDLITEDKMAINQAKKSENTESWGNIPNWGNLNWNNWANWNNFNNPLPNFDKLRKEVSKNMEATSAANQVTLESLQTISRKATEIMQQNARQSLECFRENCNSKSPAEVQSRSSDFINNFVQSFCNNAREMADIASKSALEVVEIYNDRMAEATKELCANSK